MRRPHHIQIERRAGIEWLILERDRDLRRSSQPDEQGADTGDERGATTGRANNQSGRHRPIVPDDGARGNLALRADVPGKEE